MPLRETLKEAGYVYVGFDKAGFHILKASSPTRLEKWIANKNHASYGLIWKNTHLEFVSSNF